MVIQKKQSRQNKQWYEKERRKKEWKKEALAIDITKWY